MCEQERLPDELVSIEKRIATFSPTTTLTRDEVIFACGKAAGRTDSEQVSGSRIWQLATVCLAGVSLALSVTIWQRPSVGETPFDNDVRVVTSGTNTDVAEASVGNVEKQPERVAIESRELLPQFSQLGSPFGTTGLRSSYFANRRSLAIHQQQWNSYAVENTRIQSMDDLSQRTTPTRQSLLAEFLDPRRSPL